jgi:hypothetical protein
VLGKKLEFFGGHEWLNFPGRVNWGVIPENIHSLGTKSGLFWQRVFSTNDVIHIHSGAAEDMVGVSHPLAVQKCKNGVNRCAKG